MESETFDSIAQALTGKHPSRWSFSPCAKYLPMMDMLICLQQDVSYRAQRVDPYLTIFWHPTQRIGVGFKIKGFKYVFDKLRKDLGLQEKDWVPVSELLEAIFDRFMKDEDRAEPRRRRRDYDYAKSVAGTLTLDPAELAAV